MEATEVFSKITYLKEGMEKLLAQGPAVSKEDIKALLEGVEAKATPEIVFNVQQLAASLAQPLAAKMPALDAAAVAKTLLPPLTNGMPTPETLRKTGDEFIAKLNSEFTRLDKNIQTFLASIVKRLELMEQRMDNTAGQMPRTVGLDAFRDKKVLLLTVGVPIICLLAMLVNSVCFRVSRSDYERLQADYHTMEDTSYYFYQQVKNYKQKFPKAAAYFPDYHRPAPADSSGQ